MSSQTLNIKSGEAGEKKTDCLVSYQLVQNAQSPWQRVTADIRKYESWGDKWKGEMITLGIDVCGEGQILFSLLFPTTTTVAKELDQVMSSSNLSEPTPLGKVAPAH